MIETPSNQTQRNGDRPTTTYDLKALTGWRPIDYPKWGGWRRELFTLAVAVTVVMVTGLAFSRLVAVATGPVGLPSDAAPTASRATTTPVRRFAAGDVTTLAPATTAARTTPRELRRPPPLPAHDADDLVMVDGFTVEGIGDIIALERVGAAWHLLALDDRRGVCAFSVERKRKTPVATGAALATLEHSAPAASPVCATPTAHETFIGTEANMAAVSISPDGAHAVFGNISEFAMFSDPPHQDIYVMDMATGSITNHTHGDNSIEYEPRWVDESTVVFYRVRVRGRAELVSLDVTSGDIAVIAGLPGTPPHAPPVYEPGRLLSVAGSGVYIVYGDYVTGNAVFARIDLETGARTSIAEIPNGPNVWVLSITSDGAYVRAGPESSATYVDLTSGVVLTLADERDFFGPPEGFIAGIPGGGVLRIIPVDSTSGQPIDIDDLSALFEIAAFEFSMSTISREDTAIRFVVPNDIGYVAIGDGAVAAGTSIIELGLAPRVVRPWL